MVPLTLAGIFIAARIAQTGILLTLAFDLMLCCLIPALFGGLFWKRSSTKAVAASSIVGLVLRLGFFVLVPTVYGADNTLLYIPNDIFSSDMDGWCTFISFGCATVAYFAVAAFCPRTVEEDEREQKELLSLEQERTISSEALYRRALKVQREDALDFYESAKKAGFPVDVELSQARHALDQSISECVGAVE